MQRWSDGFTNAFLLIYAVDGGLSLLEETLRLATGQTALLGLRNAVALPVFYVSFLAIPFLATTPRLPARLLLPLFVSTLWLGNLAAPLPLLIDPPALGLVTAGLQVAFAGLAYAWVRRRQGGWLWVTPTETPAFAWRHWLRMMALVVFVVIPGFALYGLVLFPTVIHVETRGFVDFDTQGILLEDRRYVRADDGKEVRLVGMMHVGEADAYRDLVRSFATESTVVLEEGVSDDEVVMEKGLDYDGMAGLLGLETQQALASYLADPETDALPEWPVLRRADVDLSAFAPETIAWLERTQELWSSRGVREALRETRRVALEEPEVVRQVQHDLFTLRNEKLLRELDAALPEFDRVIVPWGALHLPEFEVAVLERGFEPTTRERRRLVSWKTVSDALR